MLVVPLVLIAGQLMMALFSVVGSQAFATKGSTPLDTRHERAGWTPGFASRSFRPLMFTCIMYDTHCFVPTLYSGYDPLLLRRISVPIAC